MGKTVKMPPIGLMPKFIHQERVDKLRFKDVCGAISRYYQAGLKISIEWVEEYNELTEKIRAYDRK